MKPDYQSMMYEIQTIKIEISYMKKMIIAGLVLIAGQAGVIITPKLAALLFSLIA